jgi:hypothetical protein
MRVRDYCFAAAGAQAGGVVAEAVERMGAWLK